MDLITCETSLSASSVVTGERVFPAVARNSSPAMFTTSDIKVLHRLCLNDPSLPTPPQSVELTSGNGIITESKAKQEIEQLVTGGGKSHRLSVVEP